MKIGVPRETKTREHRVGMTPWCITTCRPTSHDQPTYEVHGVVHYCVPDLPGAVPQTSTWALTNTNTIDYAVRIADLGLRSALGDPALAASVNTLGGAVTCKPVAEAHGLPYVEVSTLAV